MLGSRVHAAGNWYLRTSERASEPRGEGNGTYTSRDGDEVTHLGPISGGAETFL